MFHLTEIWYFKEWKKHKFENYIINIFLGKVWALLGIVLVWEHDADQLLIFQKKCFSPWQVYKAGCLATGKFNYEVASHKMSILFIF